MSASVARIRDSHPEPGATSWPHDADHAPVLSIGRVVEELKTEFPAISLSKVRYLESEGLVSPRARVPATASTLPPTWSVCDTSCPNSAILSLHSA